MLRRAIIFPVLSLALGACGDDSTSDGAAGSGGSGGAQGTTVATASATGSTSSATSGSASTAGTGGDDSTSGSGGSGGTGAPTTGSGGAGGSGSGGETGEGGSGGSGGSKGEGGGFEACADYPATLTFPDTQPEAAADLQSFAPSATLNWAPVRGTLSSASGLGVALDCAANGDDLWEAAWAVLEAHPDLFQLDRSEWGDTGPYPCSVVNGVTIASTYRTSLAGVGVRKDVFSIVAVPGDDGLVLNGVSAFYLPVLAPGAIVDCPMGPDHAFEDVARDATYDYSTYSFCAPTGSGTYAPQPDDTIELGDTYWEWDDGTGVVVARELREATLIIDPSHVTPELEASDANCPDESGDERVYGFSLVFDAITGEIVSVRPGVGCIVC